MHAGLGWVVTGPVNQSAECPSRPGCYLAFRPDTVVALDS